MKAILTFLRKHCPRLSHLDLSEWEDADDRLLRDAFSSCLKESAATSEVEEGEDEGEEDSNGFAMLQELNLASTWVTDRGMAFLPPSLTRLDLSGLGKAFTDSGLKRLAQRCTRLVALNMCDTSVTNSGLQCLSDDLHHLDVSFTNVCVSFLKPKYYSGCWSNYSPPVPVPLPRNLRVLKLMDLKGHYFAGLTKPLMAALCSCQHLRTLHLSTQHQMKLPYTHVWMKMTALRELKFSHLDISEVKALWFLPDGLQSLSISDIDSTFKPEHIQCLPSSLTSLDFSPKLLFALRPLLLPLKRTLPELKRLRISGFSNYLAERLQLIEMGVDVGPYDAYIWQDVKFPESVEEEPSCPREQNERWRAELERPSSRRLEDNQSGREGQKEAEESLVPVDKIDVAPDQLDDEDEAEEDDQGTLLAVGW
jgi:hypothetical protein